MRSCDKKATDFFHKKSFGIQVFSASQNYLWDFKIFHPLPKTQDCFTKENWWAGGWEKRKPIMVLKRRRQMDVKESRLLPRVRSFFRPSRIWATISILDSSNMTPPAKLTRRDSIHSITPAPNAKLSISTSSGFVSLQCRGRVGGGVFPFLWEAKPEKGAASFKLDQVGIEN